MGLAVWALKPDGKIRNRRDMYCVQGTGDVEGVFCDRVFGLRDRDEFLAGVDYLVLTLPLTPLTRGLIGERELRLLKPSCVLINPARAPIVEEDALVRCMREGWIRGASLDVHYAYPLPPEHPLWSMPNVILTPHISGSAANPHFLERTYDIFVQNLRRYRGGEPLLNELTPEQLKGQ
jgi:phosphoglycerate dehydrogenase-like enzyme